MVRAKDLILVLWRVLATAFGTLSDLILPRIWTPVLMALVPVNKQTVTAIA